MFTFVYVHIQTMYLYVQQFVVDIIVSSSPIT